MPCLEGFLQRERVAEIYAEESGREVHDLEWFEMFAAQRFAIVSIRTTWRTVGVRRRGAARRPRRRHHVPQPARGDGRASRGTVSGACCEPGIPARSGAFAERGRAARCEAPRAGNERSVTWEPPPRPDWVRAVNDGRHPAHRRGGGDALGPRRPVRRGAGHVRPRRRWHRPTSASDDFLEPLDVLLPALEEEADLTVIGPLDDAALPPALPRGADPAGAVRARRPGRGRRGDPRALVRDRRAAHRHDHPPRVARAGPGLTRARGLGAAAAGPAARPRPGRVRGGRPHPIGRPRAAAPRPGRR